MKINFYYISPSTLLFPSSETLVCLPWITVSTHLAFSSFLPILHTQRGIHLKCKLHHVISFYHFIQSPAQSLYNGLLPLLLLFFPSSLASNCTCTFLPNTLPLCIHWLLCWQWFSLQIPCGWLPQLSPVSAQKLPFTEVYPDQSLNLATFYLLCMAFLILSLALPFLSL